MADGGAGALQKAMQKGADSLGKSQQAGALAAAVNRLDGWQKRASNMKAHAKEAGLEVVHTLETSTSAFALAMAEGYWGREKMLVGGFDARLGVGLLGKGYAIYEALNGDGDGHIGALSQGFLDAGLVSLGIDAGRKLAEKKAQQAQPAPAAPAAPPPAAVPAMRGPMRELSLSGPGPGPRAPARSRRFVDVPLDG